MNKGRIGIAALALTTALSLGGLHAQNRKPNATDDAFVRQAIQGDMAEVQIGQLAEQKGENQQVKQFGRTLATDHGENLEKAKSLAQKIGVTPPNSVSVKQKATYDKLSKLSGEQFDRRFARDMVREHKKDINAFDRESKKSGAVADFAQNTVPVLKKHLEMAESLSGSTKTTGSAR